MTDVLKHDFDNNCYTKHLQVNVKSGFYKLFNLEGKEEIVQADNAKEALTKTTFKKVKKLYYLGFTKQIIFKKEDLSLENDLSSDASNPQDSDNFTNLLIVKE